MDGLTVWHEARLQEEDVENIHNMATADIVDLMLSTRFPPHRIVEWVDQSILLSFLAAETHELTAKRRNELRDYGITNATGALVTLYNGHVPAGTEVTVANDKRKELVPWLTVLADNLKTNTNLPLVRIWKNIDLSVLTKAPDAQVAAVK